MQIRYLTLLIASLWACTAQSAPVQVVVSIKPVHSLVAAIMGETGDPTLLITGGTSPHIFSLKPSHAIALSHADLVIWIGPDFERFLDAPLSNLAANTRSLPLLQVEGMVHLPTRTGGIWGAPHTHEEEAHEAAGNEVTDPHIWLDISNAIIMTHAIEDALSEIYPDHAVTFARNAEELRMTLSALGTEITSQTAPVAARPFFVFHDAYQYFENRYHLSPLGAVTVSPDIRPGARRLIDMRKVGKAQDHLCVFAEPQFEPRLLQVLTENTNGQLAYLDPLGSDIPAGPEQYAQTMRNLTENLVNCLTQP
ncbi:MAG: zinc ABC transporter substrate-binding protein [Rhodobiaceae bacterium]|nr:MAG: zinc ABC transporter substrate-binding protein [Rhodobiaceae bacterium]